MSSLTDREKIRIMELYKKLKEKNLRLEEAREYQQIIEKDKEEAIKNGDLFTALGLLSLGASLILYLASSDSR